MGRGILPPVTRREDITEEEWLAAKAAVSVAAGRVSDVPRITGLRIAVAGAGEFDVFAAWVTVTQPKPLFEPDDVLSVCGQAIGRLEAMAERARAEAPIQVDVEAMHPLIWGAARKLWRGENYREAVHAAVGAMIEQVRALTGRSELAENYVLQEAFSNADPQPGKPRLRWRVNSSDQTVKSMNEGLRLYNSGVRLAIRNPAVHDRAELGAQEGAERLAAISLLARWIEECELVEE